MCFFRSVIAKVMSLCQDATIKQWQRIHQQQFTVLCNMREFLNRSLSNTDTFSTKTTTENHKKNIQIIIVIFEKNTQQKRRKSIHLLMIVQHPVISSKKKNVKNHLFECNINGLKMQTESYVIIVGVIVCCCSLKQGK